MNTTLINMEKKTVDYRDEELHIVKNSIIIACLRYSDIVAITADTPYVVIQVKDDEKGIQVRASLVEMIDQLPRAFFLIHQSAIVNLQYMQSYNKGVVCLKDGQTYEVARRRKKKSRALSLFAKEVYAGLRAEETLRRSVFKET